MGDKIAGAMKKLKGTIMRNPGEKVSREEFSQTLLPSLAFRSTNEVFHNLGCRNPSYARYRWSW